MCVLIVILAFIITHNAPEVNPHPQIIRETTQFDSTERFVYNKSNSLWVSDYEVVTQSKQSINRYSTLIRHSSHQCLIGCKLSTVYENTTELCEQFIMF